MKTRYRHDNDGHEIGIDEAGRGPLFGRVYAAAVCLPTVPTSGSSFRYEDMRDSKQFAKREKREAVAAYLCSHPEVTWSVSFVDSADIDRDNIRQAVLRAMREAATETVRKLREQKGEEDKDEDEKEEGIDSSSTLLLVDGNDFVDKDKVLPPFVTVKQGDRNYAAIAAASILAKTFHDQWIDTMCDTHPWLDELYALRQNKGYGTAAHIQGLRDHGPSPWHRLSFQPLAGMLHK